MQTVAATPAGLDIEPILAALDPEQRAAATLPDGPAQIIAPAGSGKTTTMVARLAVLLSRGVEPARICVVTFNRDAALDLAARVAKRLGPQVPDATTIEIRTLHALARQVLLDAGEGRNILADRLPLLRAARRRHAAADASVPLPEAAQLDTWLSAWKVEGREPPAEALAVLRTYEELLRARGAVDFDDLVVRACELLETDPAVRLRWQSRFEHVCVDEFQDVDAAQLRLVRLLAAPQDNLFVVGDDDQTIYAWRLADVRRILRFADDYPSARRVMLATNYRCPAAVIDASARMVAVNRERFAKPIRAPDGLAADPRSISAVSTADADWPEAMARLAAAEDRRGADALLPVADARRADADPARSRPRRRPRTAPPCRRSSRPSRCWSWSRRRVPPATAAIRSTSCGGCVLGRGWDRGSPSGDLLSDEDHAAIDALLGWATGFRTVDAFVEAFDGRPRADRRTPRSRRPVELATVHASKGREWETVVLIGFEADRIPNRRSLDGRRRSGSRARGGAAAGLRGRHPRDAPADPRLRSGAAFTVPRGDGLRPSLVTPSAPRR